MRLGIRVQDILDPKILRQKIEAALAEKNLWLERVYESEPFDLETVASQYEGYAKRLRPYVSDTSLYVDNALRDGKAVLFEGAQATLLDLDHGTYPFVTSSNPVASSAATGVGIGPDAHRPRHRRREGVRDARRRGPVPVRDRGRRPGADARARRRVRHGHRDEAAAAAGSTSSRSATRCASTASTSSRSRSSTCSRTSPSCPSACGTRCATAARPAISRRTRATSTQRRPVYETLPGWHEPLDGCTSVDDLPAAARRYVEFVERGLDVEVTLVGTGAERKSVLTRA